MAKTVKTIRTYYVPDGANIPHEDLPIEETTPPTPKVKEGRYETIEYYSDGTNGDPRPATDPEIIAYKRGIGGYY